MDEKRFDESDQPKKSERNKDEEFATEVAPAPLLGGLTPNRPAEVDSDDFYSEEGANARTGGRTVGWIGLVLAIASLFIYPVVLGMAALILGITAFVQGSRALGGWSAVIGGIALIAYFVIVPYYT